MSELSRALIVEVDDNVRGKLFSALLDREVFSDTAHDCKAALECLQAGEFGVIILDLRLPDCDDVLAAIQCLAADRRPMVIGTGDRDMTHELDDNVIQIVIRKPIALRQFADVVRSCLEAAPRWRRASESDQSGELRTL